MRYVSVRYWCSFHYQVVLNRIMLPYISTSSFFFLFCSFQRQDYLGEKIALYFALLGHYTAWLGWLSIAGVVMAINQIMQLNIDAMLAPYFAIFVSFWAVSCIRFFFFQQLYNFVLVCSSYVFLTYVQDICVRTLPRRECVFA